MLHFSPVFQKGFFSFQGGVDGACMARSILSKLLAKSVASHLNWKGTEHKAGIKGKHTPEVILGKSVFSDIGKPF